MDAIASAIGRLATSLQGIANARHESNAIARLEMEQRDRHREQSTRDQERIIGTMTDLYADMMHRDNVTDPDADPDADPDLPQH